MERYCKKCNIILVVGVNQSCDSDYCKNCIPTSITCGEKYENGFCDTYIDGVKSNVRLLVFSENEIEKIREIQRDLYVKEL